jgi:large subunit ribosomal protein L35Ae
MAEIKGIVKNFRLGSRTQNPNGYVITIEGYDKKKSSALIGKSVAWKSTAGKAIIGKITGVHGDKGAVKATFSKGLPGQAIGSEVLIK